VCCAMPRNSRNGFWRVDETYVRVAGGWKYRFRAVEKYGRLIDLMLVIASLVARGEAISIPPG
jgi:transposase-like protein